jgi:hypothetical protein
MSLRLEGWLVWISSGMVKMRGPRDLADDISYISRQGCLKRKVRRS